jgi:hypothetical protein
VGDLEGGVEDLHPFGVAPDDARPPASEHSTPATPSSAAPTAAPAAAPAPPDKSQAYEDYKQGAGAELGRALTAGAYTRPLFSSS